MSRLTTVRTGEGPTLVMLHGFTQTVSSLAPLSTLLATSRTVVAVDLPGHGASSSVSADLDEAAGLVTEAAGDSPFDLVGYSLGGRIALHVAASAPTGLRATVAISASPGLADVEARASRLARDVAMADALEADGDVGAFIARWLANPMFATLPAARADATGRLANTAAGLADSLRRCSLGSQRWLVPELVTLPTPLLMIAGARDDPFLSLACAVAAASSAVGAAAVPGAGHACHLEQPGTVARLIDGFFSSTGSRRDPQSDSEQESGD